MDSSKNIYQVKSSYLMELDGIRREKNLTWDATFTLEEVHLESGTGSPELETDVHIINSNPAWKGLLESQSQRKGVSNNFCDVHIHASDGYIPVHRVFLQNKSEFLDNLIKENLRVSMPQCSNHSANLISISLMDVKLVHLKTVMVLLYTGVAVIKEKDEHDIKNVIRMLQMGNNVKVEKEVHDPSVKRKRKDLRCFYSIEEDIHVSGGSSNNCHPPQGAPSGTGRLRTTSGSSSTPPVSSAKPSDVPSFIPPPPPTFRKKLPMEHVHRNLENTSEVDEQQQRHTQPESSENAVVNNNQLPRHPDIPPEVTEVPPGTLLPLGKQQRTVKPPLPTRGRGRGRGRGKGRRRGGRTCGMTTRNVLKSQADDEDSNGPKSRYEMDDEYVPSDAPNEEDDNNADEAMEVSDNELEQGPTCSTRNASRSRSKSKDPSFANEDDNCPSKRYPKRRRKDSSGTGPFKETLESSSRSDAPATVADTEPGPSITRDHLETLKRLSGEGVHNYAGHRCFFCGDIFEEEPVLIAHLKSSCAKLIDSMYDLRKKHCKACHTFFLNYSASDFMDHVSTCCVGKRIRGKSASNEGPAQTQPSSANVVVDLNIATQEPGSFPETVVLPELCLTVDRLEDDEIILFIDKLKRREEIAITLPKLGRGHKYVEWRTIEEPTPPANAPAAPLETITAEPPTNVPSHPQETTTGEPPASSKTSEIVRPAVDNQGVSRNISAFAPPYSSTPNECAPIRNRPGPKSARWKDGLGLEIKNKPGPKSSKMTKGSNEKNKEVETRKGDKPDPPSEPENICPPHPPRTGHSAAAKLRASLKMKLGPKLNLCLSSRIRTSTLGSSAIEDSPTNDSVTSAAEANSTLATAPTSAKATTAKVASGPKTTNTTSFAKVSGSSGTGNVASLANESNWPVITNVTSSAKVSSTPGTTNVIKETLVAPVKPRSTPLAVNAAKESVAPVGTQNQLQTVKVGPQHCLRSTQVGARHHQQSAQVGAHQQQQSAQLGAHQQPAQVGAQNNLPSGQIGAQHNVRSAQVDAQNLQQSVHVGTQQHRKSPQHDLQSAQVCAQHNLRSAQMASQHHRQSAPMGSQNPQQLAQVGEQNHHPSNQHHLQSVQVGSHAQEGVQHRQPSAQVSTQHHRHTAQVGGLHQQQPAQVGAQLHQHSVQLGPQNHLQSVQVGAQHYRQSTQIGQNHFQTAQAQHQHQPGLQMAHGQPVVQIGPQQVHTQFMSSISVPQQSESALIPHQGYHNAPMSNPSSMVTYNYNPQQQMQNASTSQTAQPMTVALQNQYPQQNTQLNVQGTITQYSVLSSSISQQNYVTPAAIAAGGNEGLGLPSAPVQPHQQFRAPNSVALYRPDQNMSYAQATIPAIANNKVRGGVRTTVHLPVSPQMNPLANGRNLSSSVLVNLLQRQESQVVAAESMSRNEHVGTAMLPISSGSPTVANQSGTVATVDPRLEHRQLAIGDVKPVIYFVGPGGKTYQERRPLTNLTCPTCNLAFQTPEALHDHVCI